MELVRYIHLNPLRAKHVEDLNALDTYAYGGHSVMMGKNKQSWQDTDYILRVYAKRLSTARRHYREYVANGIDEGRNPDLVGGGLVRSAGGWSAVKAMRKGFERIKGDERILGDSQFVETVLKAARENLEQKYRLEAEGCDFDWLVERVADQLGIEPQDVLAPGKYAQNVKARSVLCYWATRELGMTTIDLAQKLKLSQPTISQSAKRGSTIVQDLGLCLLENS